jgi:uncharacterized protein
MTQDRYIPGVPCWVDTNRADPAATAAFYGRLFDWEVVDTAPAGADRPYLIGRRDGRDAAAIGGLVGGGAAPPLWSTYVWVDRADEAADRARRAGGAVLAEPTDVSGTGRMAVLADREGAAIRVWEPRAHRGAAVVNELGGVNFNDLHTRDVEAAAAFYGAVFGWEVLDLGDGLMWTLPGYGAFLDGLNPGFLEGMAAMGTPPGFEDVVASLAVITDPGTSPHWSVTWAVDDADETARRAVQLGGRVVAPPVDAPWVRTTVLADPDGVAFVASTFVPDNAGVEPVAADR